LIGDWGVSGRTVHVSNDTRVKAKKGLAVVVGILVDVRGLLNADGSITASKITVRF
jgi:hypothetical protein